ncbi:MAG: serine/threonine protein kinase [Planctomycetota bacterium]
MTSRLQPGLVLADSQLEREANTYLQRRLIVFYGVALVLAVALYVVSILVLAMTEGWTWSLLVAPDKLVHLAAVLCTGAILNTLRRRSFRANALVLFDALSLFLAVATCTTIYSMPVVYRMAPHSISGIMGLFIVARAVVVPCSAKTTFLLSAPISLAVLIPQLAYGTIYSDIDVEYAPEQYPIVIVWHQVTLWMSVGIAALASKINFGLRHQVRKAEKLGQYRLEERIGKGGMGEVFRARHAMLRRPTAVKLIHPDSTDPELFQRFEREVRQTSRLSHPNTISIFDYGRTPEGVFYYAMEYLDGADLREIIEKTGPMPPARVIHVLSQTCGALREAHGVGLVHRDIKAGNIMVCRSGGEHDVVKVVDFGLVKDMSGTSPVLTQLGQVCGTPETLAPEILGGEEATAQSDLYSLGVVAYYMLTGISVYDAKSAADYIGHHLHTPAVPLHERAPSVPQDLETAIHRCLEKDPAHRFADANEMREALAACKDAGLWTQSAAIEWWRELEAA